MVKYQSLLNEYLIEKGVLPLAGTGRLLFETRPAIGKDEDAVIEPPYTSLVFSQAALSEEELESLVAFIRQQTAVSSRQVVEWLTGTNTVAAQLEENDRLDWPPFGYFQKEKERITFRQDTTFNTYLPAIPIPKKLQQSVSNGPVEPVLLYEEPESPETPDESLQEIYKPAAPVRKDRWWVWAIILFAVSILLIIVRYAGLKM